ncbi:MAG: rod shape-determining protein MreD [Bacteroidia bacterium]|nr:rod shape-determining protein MreD [Bacteroidia bacterium]
MVISQLKYVLIFAVSVLLQVLIFNNIVIAKVLSPYIYILFIVLLPFDTPKALMLFLAVSLGLTMDLFTNTPGVHASATLLIGFARPLILKLITTRETLESFSTPRVGTMGFHWFATYVSILVVIHHFFLFFLEAFTFDGFFITLLRIILSSALSVILIVLSQFLIFRR